MEFVIRQLKEKDLERASGFFETLSNLSGNIKDYNLLTMTKRKKVWELAKKQGSYFFVAVSKEKDTYGQIVSTVKLIVEPKFFYGGKSAGHIEDVATRSGFEGRGLAKALMSEALRVAKSKGCYKVVLDCKNKIVPFYRKLDFKRHGAYMRLDFKK